MKNKKRFLTFLFGCLFLILLFAIGDGRVVTAETPSEELNEMIVDQLGELDLKALQDYVDSLDGFSESTVAERLLKYIKGEPFDYENFFVGMSEVLFSNVKKLLPAFSSIAAITLLCGIVSSLKSNFLSASSGEMIFLVCYVSVLIPILSVVIECFSRAQASALEMQKQMQIVFPIMLTLMATSGGTVSAAIYRPTVAFLSNAIVSLVTEVVFPMTLTIIAFSMAGNLLKEMKFEKFTAFFKSINKWVIGVGVSVFGLFFTLQGLTAASYDGIARRAAKYAIGTGVPIVGGFLSGGFDLAVAGSILIKNSLGSMSVFLMVAVLFEPLVLLIATIFLLRLTAAVTQPLGDSRVSDFLSSTADNLNYCVAGLLFTAFLYFICILLIVCSTEVFF